MHIDIIRYARLPNISLMNMLRLAKTLLRDIPQNPTPAVSAAASELETLIQHIEQALTRRMQATHAPAIASQADLDRWLDALWTTKRRLLEVYEVYAHPGAAALSEAEANDAELPDLLHDAERARFLHERLFGQTGTSFTQLPYAEQAETMATILRNIDDQGLGEELEALIDPRLLKLLRICQRRYEDMVSDRLTRQLGLSEDLRELRNQLRWHIMQYNTAVIGLAKYGDAASIAVVERALLAVTRIRPNLSSAAVEDEETDDALLDGLEDDEPGSAQEDPQPQQGDVQA